MRFHPKGKGEYFLTRKRDWVQLFIERGKKMPHIEETAVDSKGKGGRRSIGERGKKKAVFA